MTSQYSKTIFLMLVLLSTTAVSFADESSAVNTTDFDIPSQSLEEALIHFSEQTDIQLVMASAEVTGLEAPHVNGRLSNQAALDALLGGTGLSYQFVNEGTVAIGSGMVKDNEEGSRDSGNSLPAPILMAQNQTSTPQTRASSPNSRAGEHDGSPLLEEIVVTGIRGGLRRSLNIKESSAGFVDAISSEDVGKLPDQNVAEALQRVPGVAIQRNRGEGDFVTIRGLGPDFVRGSINGRSLLSATEVVDPIINGGIDSSTGRAANFDTLPSQVIDVLEVVKSPSAKHVEGGIGGVVNVKTARPLVLGNKVSATLEGVYREFSEETDPSASAIVSWTNDDNTFGLLGSVAYSERSIREDFSRTFGWFASSGFGTVGPFDIDNDGTSDGVTSLAFPLSNNLESYVESRDRLTFVGTAQWQLGAGTDISLDVIYSDRDVESENLNFVYLPIPRQGLGDLSGQPVNPDGSIQVGNLVRPGSSILASIPSTFRPGATRDLQEYSDELLSVALNVGHEVGDWKLNADVHYSIAEADNRFDRVNHTADNGVFSFVTDVGLDGFAITQTNTGGGPQTDIGNANNYLVRVLDDRIANNEDDEFALQFDVVRSFNGGFLDSVEAGVRFRDRSKDIARRANGNGINVLAAGLSPANIGVVNGRSNFLDGGLNSTFSYESLVFADNAAVRAALVPFLDANGLSTEPPPSPFSAFVIDEATYAVYGQLNLDQDIGGMRLIGDVGVRIVHTQQDVNGFDSELRVQDNGGQLTTIFDSLTAGEATPFLAETTYTNVLPSLNLRLSLDDSLYLRFSSSKTVTRPTFNSLSPGLDVNANCSCDINDDNFAIAAVAGNPSLEPYISTNFDLGIEWYFGDASAVYAGLFHKDIEDFIATVTNTDVNTLGGQPIRIVGIEMDASENPISIDQMSQPANQGDAQVTGAEIGYAHAFASGFGYSANVTLTENSAEFTQTGVEIDFPGVSETNFNITAYYERDRFQARTSYTERSDFLVVPDAIGVGGQIFADGYGQLDASVSYSISDNISIFANAINITDEEQLLYEEIQGSNDRLFYSLSHVGARYSIGVRATF